MSTLDLTGAAKRMYVHENTVVRLITAGEIPAAKIGRAWVMREADIDDYVQRQIDLQTASRMGLSSPAAARRARNN